MIGVMEQGAKGVGELADGNAFVVAGSDFLHQVAAAFEHVVEEFEFEVGEVPVLAVVELASEFVLVGAPAAQRFEGDAEAVFDEAEVAVVLVEEVERLDFGVEGVAGRHG